MNDALIPHNPLDRYMYKGYGSACASSGQRWIRKTLLDLYKPTADMFPGKEEYNVSTVP